MNIKYKIEELTKIFLYFTIFFMWVEMVMPSLILSISFNKIFFTITLIFFIIYVFLNKEKFTFYKKSKLNNFIILFLLIYIVLDITGLLYSPVFNFAIKQYSTLIPMLILILIGYVMINTKKDFNYLIIIIGIAAIVISLYSLFIYFIAKDYKLIYYKRISLIDDYNIFSTQIMIGTIILMCFFSKKFIRKYKLIDYLIFLLIELLNIPLVILSGSRRSIVILIVYSFIGIIILLGNIIKNKNLQKIIIGCLILLSSLISIFLMTNLEINLLNKSSEKNRIRSVDTEVAIGKHSETDLKDRYDTIASYDGMSKRIYIWKVAINEFKTYSKKEILIGKGSAYDCYLFYNRGLKGLDRELYGENTKNYPLGALYSHNIFLTDLLNGGIIKLIVQLILFILILIQIFVVLKNNGALGTILLFCWGIILSNILISTKGILYYKSYWIFILINLISIKICDKNKMPENFDER